MVHCVDEFIIVGNSTSSASSSDSDSEVSESWARPRQVVLFEYKQNDPKRDTGMKLVRNGLARSLHPGTAFKGIVLSAQGNSVLSAADAPMVQSVGIAAVNCSWNRIDEITNVPGGSLSRHRKLPFLIAANPINYGKAFKLSSAEAVAGGLGILGFVKFAKHLTKKFSWHDEFWKLNEELIQGYAECGSSSEVIQMQATFMTKADKQSVDYESIGVEDQIDVDILPIRVSSLKRSKSNVRFNPDGPQIKEFAKNDPPSTPAPVVIVSSIVELEVSTPRFPEQAPKDQKKCLLFLQSLAFAEELGIPKHASGNALAKLKKKEYLDIWESFVRNDDNVKYVADLENSLRKK